MLLFRLNRFPQTWHSNGLSPVCDRMCLSNTDAAVKGLPQYTQRRLFAGPCLNGCLDPGNERYFVNIGDFLDLIHVL